MRKFFTSTPFLALLTCILWGSSFVPTKTGLEFMQAPLQFAGYTFVISGIVLMPWAKFGKHYFEQVFGNFGIMLKVALFSIAILYGSFYTGQNLTDASIVSLIVGCQPFFVALLAHLLLRSERFTKRKIAGLALGMTGIVVVSWQSFSDIKLMGLSSALGIIFIIIDCLSAAYGNIIVSQIDFKKVDIKVLNSFASFLGGVILLIVAYPAEGIAPLPSEAGFYISLGAMVFITVVTTVVWMRLLSRPNVEVTSLNMWKFVMPLVGSAESWLLLKNDKPTPYTIAGLVIITFSLLIFFSTKKHTAKGTE